MNPLEEGGEEVLGQHVHRLLLRAILEAVHDALRVSEDKKHHSNDVDGVEELLLVLAGDRVLDVRNALRPVVGEVVLEITRRNGENRSDLLHGDRDEARDADVGLHAQDLSVSPRRIDNGDNRLSQNGLVFGRDNVLLTIVAVSETVLKRDGSALRLRNSPNRYQLDAVGELVISENGEKTGEESRGLRHLSRQTQPIHAPRPKPSQHCHEYCCRCCL